LGNQEPIKPNTLARKARSAGERVNGQKVAQTGMQEEYRGQSLYYEGLQAEPGEQNTICTCSGRLDG